MALALWAAAALRNGGLGRGIALYGCIIAPLLIMGVGSGHLSLNIHGMAIIAAGQGIWFIGVGAQLCGPSIKPTATSA